jgi:hypothetical protein
MRWPRVAAVLVCFGLIWWLTPSGNVLAQGVPYRTRFPSAGPAGAVVPPPPLIGSVPSTMDPTGRRFRPFVPYPYFGWHWYDSTAGYSSQTNPAVGGYSAELKPALESYRIDDTTAVGRLQVSSESRGSKMFVRLTWENDHRVNAAQVAFFLADQARVVFAAQTVRAPPFTALFETNPGTAFTGMTVVLPGGTLVTQFLPYQSSR